MVVVLVIVFGGGTGDSRGGSFVSFTCCSGGDGRCNGSGNIGSGDGFNGGSSSSISNSLVVVVVVVVIVV
jgi:hypothetical protein